MAEKTYGVVAFLVAAVAAGILLGLAQLAPAIIGVGPLGGVQSVALSFVLRGAGLALGHLLVAWPLDKLGEGRTAAVALAVAGLGAAAALIFAEGPAQGLVSQALIGIAVGAVFSAGVTYVARGFGLRAAALAIAGYVAFFSLARALGPVLLGMSMDGLDLSGGVAAAAGAVLLASALLAATPRAEAPAGVRGPDRPRWSAYAAAAFLLAVCLVAAEYGAGSTSFLYVQTAFDPDARSLGEAALTTGLAAILGLILYGALDRATGARRGLALGGGVLLAAALVGSAFLGGRSMNEALAVFATIALLAGLYPVLAALVAETLPAERLGRGIAWANFLAAALSLRFAVAGESSALHRLGAAAREWIDRLAPTLEIDTSSEAAFHVLPLLGCALLLVAALALFTAVGGRARPAVERRAPEAPQPPRAEPSAVRRSRDLG